MSYLKWREENPLPKYAPPMGWSRRSPAILTVGASCLGMAFVLTLADFWQSGRWNVLAIALLGIGCLLGLACDHLVAIRYDFVVLKYMVEYIFTEDPDGTLYVPAILRARRAVRERLGLDPSPESFETEASEDELP